MPEVPTIRVGAPLPGGRQLFVAVVGLDAALCDRFIRSAMAGREAPFGEIIIEGWTVLLKRMSDPPDQDPAWAPRMTVADGVILLAQYLDHLSLSELEVRRRRIPSEENLPVVALFCRTEGSREFKISCPACRQKLWVHDQEIGKRGRCVNCNGVIDIVSPADLLRRELRLGDRVPILSVDPMDPGLCRGAVASLMTRKGFGLRNAGQAPLDFMKKSTVAIIPQEPPPRR